MTMRINKYLIPRRELPVITKVILGIAAAFFVITFIPNIAALLIGVAIVIFIKEVLFKK